MIITKPGLRKKRTALKDNEKATNPIGDII